MKRNVFEWICGTMTDATSAIVLTHNIDFLFLQSIVRPRLRKCGNPKLTIFADAGCATGSYRQQRFALDGLGRHYRVVPVVLESGRRFHPKAILLAGPSKAALAVGSGNVTHGGWSANHEIWATYESDDGLPAISAFRNYLDTVLSLIPQSDRISEEALSAFDDSANSWATELPKPAGLHGTPSDRPLLDRIIGLAGDDVRQITVCAPYYDPAGKALAELALRTTAPIRTLLQRSHVGLSASAASALPPNVQLISIDTEPARFIHAKLYGFHRSHSTLLVAGSANMSRAALMADRTWGNAELVAVQETSQEQFDELLADLTILDQAPNLPERPPLDEWEFPTEPIRILTARFVDGTLEIAFKSDETIKDFTVEVDNSLTVKLLVLVRPHFPSRLIDRFHQIPDRIPVEAPQEVPLRGRRRHLAGPQRVQIHRVPASSLHVLQAATARHDVVNQIEHMIRFPVRQMPLQHLHPLVDGFGQFQLLDQQLDHTQPPAVHGSDSIRNLIMDVTRRPFSGIQLRSNRSSLSDCRLRRISISFGFT